MEMKEFKLLGVKFFLVLVVLQSCKKDVPNNTVTNTVTAVGTGVGFGPGGSI